MELEVLRDPKDLGHSEAATLGIVRAKALGAECAVLLPGDCPLLDPAELDAALGRASSGSGGGRAGPPRHRHQRARAVRHPTRSGPRSGPAAARVTPTGDERAGHAVEVEPLDSLSLDLDTPADLDALAAILEREPGRARATAAALERSGRLGASRADGPRVELIAVRGLPEIGPGDPVGELIAGAAPRAAVASSRAGDVVVISQKVVSKAEGRVRDLARIEPGARARELAGRLGKDPRLVELVLAESRELIRAERGVLIVETSGGLVCANAGIDASNVPGDDRVTLLPEDPDASARRIRAEFAAAAGRRPGGRDRRQLRAPVAARPGRRRDRLRRVDAARRPARTAPTGRAASSPPR